MYYIEFSKRCRPLNMEYKKLFGKVPTPDDYECNCEQYLDALKKSIAEQCPLEMLLEKAKVPDSSRYDY